MKKKIDIRQLSLENLTDEIIKLGENPTEPNRFMIGFGKKEPLTSIK